jgi:hypothetical protein
VHDGHKQALLENRIDGSLDAKSQDEREGERPLLPEQVNSMIQAPSNGDDTEEQSSQKCTSEQTCRKRPDYSSSIGHELTPQTFDFERDIILDEPFGFVMRHPA